MREADLKVIERGLKSAASAEQMEAAHKLRELLSSERDSLVHEVLLRGWVPHLLSWLKLREQPLLQVEALWALTNIAAGTVEHTHVLIKHGAVPTLVTLLDSPDEEVLEQAVWVLGNLAGEGVSARDAVLQAGALEPLLRCLDGTPKISLLRIATWTLSNLFDGQPRPVLDMPRVLAVLAALLDNTDTEVLSHVCWALSHLCDGPATYIVHVASADVCWRLVELLMHNSWRVNKPALRAIGNIVCAEEDTDYTQHVIDCGAVANLAILVEHSNREIQKEACWTLSNIAAGTAEQIQHVLDSKSMPPLVALARAVDTDPEVKSEACWVVLNATSCGSDAQIDFLVKEGCVPVLCELLAESSMVVMALEGLERILQVGDDARGNGGSNPYAALMASASIEGRSTSRARLPAGVPGRRAAASFRSSLRQILAGQEEAEKEAQKVRRGAPCILVPALACSLTRAAHHRCNSAPHPAGGEAQEEGREEEKTEGEARDDGRRLWFCGRYQEPRNLTCSQSEPLPLERDSEPTSGHDDGCDGHDR